MAELLGPIKLDEIGSPSGELMRNYGVTHNDMSSNMRQPRSAARFDVTPATDRRKAPFLGEHNAIVEELGHSESEAGKLASSGVLATRSDA